MSTTLSHKDRLISFLKKDIGGFGMTNKQVSSFSQELKDLEILDLSKSNTQEWVMNNSQGQASLVTLGTWSQLGLLSKLVEIKILTKGR